MASKSKKTGSRSRIIRGHTGAEFCDAYFYNLPREDMNLGRLFDKESPNNVKDAFQKGREWAKKNWFVATMLLLKGYYLTYGLKLVPKDKSKKKKFNDWLIGEKSGAPSKNKIHLLKYIQSAANEFLLQDTLISFWLEKESDFPVMLLPEICKLDDAFGFEKLSVTFATKKREDLETGDLTAKQIERYTSGRPVILSENEGERWMVSTRGLIGQGFHFPRLFSIFRTLSQNESMEVGESMLAYAGRLVLRVHQKGYEPKNHTAGLKMKDYSWTKEWSDEVKTFFKNKLGFAEMTASFDHKISYLWVDPKYFEAKKWETIINRLVWWGGPLAFMLMAKTQSINWIKMLETEIDGIRSELLPHLDYVLNSIYPEAPGGIDFKFSDECFKDARLVWDMLKTLMQQGPASLSTALKKANLDTEEERENKSEEAKKENAKYYTPLVFPGQGKASGRNPGSKDGDVVS